MNVTNRTQAGKFVVILGIDGSGKTSIASRLEDFGYCVSSWKRLASIPLPPDQSASDYSTVAYIRGLPFGNYLESMPARTRSIFALTLAFAEYDYLIKPKLETGSLVISEGYYFRIIAKEIVKGVGDLEILKLAKSLPLPDAIVYLHLVPESAFHRKGGRVSSHETLCANSVEDFTRFQERVEKVCDELTVGIRKFTVDSTKDLDTIFDAVLKFLEDI